MHLIVLVKSLRRLFQILKETKTEVTKMYARSSEAEKTEVKLLTLYTFDVEE